MGYFVPPLSFVFCLGAVLVARTYGQSMTECDRGVKRAHPSQENAFQIFTRTQWTSSWLDQYCPSPQIFHHELCACVAPTPTTIPTTISTTISTTIPTTVPTTPPQTSKKSPWFDRAKIMERQIADGTQKGERRRKVKVLKRQQQPQQQQQLQQQHQQQQLQHQQQQQLQQQQQEPVKQDDDVPVRSCKDFRPAEDPSQYEQKTQDGVWVTLNCNWPAYSGLVWSQEMCRCDWGPNRTSLHRLQYDSAPAKCLMMLNLNFDDGELKDVGRDLWLDLRHPLSMEAVRDETAVGGWAGSFWGAGISVPFFKQNTFGSTFRIKFRFQICDGHPDADLMLINNGCMESDALPSIQVSYRAWTRTLAFQMETMKTLGPYREECQIQADPQSTWIDVNIHYDENILEIFANGEQCVRSAAYAGAIMPIDCPLTLLEDNFCGMLDEVMMTRGCTLMQES